jgi:hypothetical protein
MERVIFDYVHGDFDVPMYGATVDIGKRMTSKQVAGNKVKVPAYQGSRQEVEGALFPMNAVCLRWKCMIWIRQLSVGPTTNYFALALRL